MAPQRTEVFSAGVSPSRVHPLSRIIRAEKGIDISGHRSEPFQQYLEVDLDVVISLSETARTHLDDFPSATRKIHWEITDPFVDWSADPGQLPVYRRTRDDLEERIRIWLKESSEQV